MPTFTKGDRVRVDITDETDPDFEWHGQHGEIINVLEDDVSELTGEETDNRIYRVDLDEYDHRIDLRHWDLRPPLEE